MFLLNNGIWYNVVAVVVTVLALFVLYFQWSFSYWKKRGLYFLKPSIPFGNTGPLFKSQYSVGEQFADFYNTFKSKGLKHGGVYMFARPFYVPVDCDIIKQIIQKDFSHFVDRGFYVNETVDPLSGHLFSLEGTKWKNLREKLTATFTSGKLKMMFETLLNCSLEFDTVMADAAKTKSAIDIKDILARFTTDVISSCAFGLDTNSLKNPNNEFRNCGKRIFENTAWENIRNLLQFALPPNILRLVKFKTSKPDVEDFILNIVKNTVDYREKNQIYRKDFLHLLLQLKNRGKLVDDQKLFNENDVENTENRMSLTEVAAQVFIFFAAGYETSSTTATLTLYELALHPQIQDKLRKEIKTVLNKHNGKISYEAMMEMSYMDKVINETLRKYPPLPFLNRICTTPYNVPGTNIHLEKGTMLIIPILGIQNDPEFYPEPEKFDPERFNEENKSTRPAIAWVPFGEGPRVCIGMRFGLMQTKVALTALLNNYSITMSEKTKQPLVMDKTSLLTSSDTGVWINVNKEES